MTNEEVATRVERELLNYRYEPGPELVGRPWRGDRVEDSLAALRAAVVAPVPILIHAEPDAVAGWLVARAAHGLLVFYDPVADEFGLGELQGGDQVTDLNVRGDLVGTYMAA